MKNICLTIFLLTLVYLVGFKTGLWGQPHKEAVKPVVQQTEAATKVEEEAAPAKETPVSIASTENVEKKEAAQTQVAAPVRQTQQASSNLSGRVESISRPRSIRGPMGTVSGPFALMSVTISNHGDSAVNIVGFGIRLIDTQGNAYSLSNEAMGTLFHLQKETFHMTGIQPGMSKTAYVVFAMPDGAEPDRLVIQPHGFVPSFEIKI